MDTRAVCLRKRWLGSSLVLCLTQEGREKLAAQPARDRTCRNGRRPPQLTSRGWGAAIICARRPGVLLAAALLPVPQATRPWISHLRATAMHHSHPSLAICRVLGHLGLSAFSARIRLVRSFAQPIAISPASMSLLVSLCGRNKRHPPVLGPR